MTTPKSYSNAEYKNLLCAYVDNLYNSLPSTLTSSLDQFRKSICGRDDSDSESGDSETNPQISLQAWIESRVKLTIPQARDVLADPWFSWDMNGDCTVLQSILIDIFQGTSVPNPREINPVVNTVGYTAEQISLLKDMGGFAHYLFARTYYIDRCYGTTAYLNHYYDGSLENFYAQHSQDYSNYVDCSELVLGSVLLSAWQNDPTFRSSLDPLSFIKPLTGLLCGDFWNWGGSSIYWWTETKLMSGDWEDDLLIQDSWYGTEGNTAAVSSDYFITPLGSSRFPAYRISVNDLYQTITFPESDYLAQLFGNSLLKGPSLIEPFPDEPCEKYSEGCAIPPPPTPSPTPTDTPTPTPTPTSTQTPTPTPTPYDPYDPYDPYNYDSYEPYAHLYE